VTIRICAALALCFSFTVGGGVAAKPAHPVHHNTRHVAHRNMDARYAQGFYDYRAAGMVREEFRDGPDARWYRGGHFDRRDFHREDFYREQYDGRVVENLRTGDFTGGVGYGLNGDVPSFVDGFGQTHFFVGSFRRMAPMGRFGAPRFGGQRFGGGFHGGFR
jgi:hypothetical protein